MTPKLAREHLDKARDTVMEVERLVCSHTYPDDKRTVMVRGELSTIIQHHRSVLLLLRSGIVTSSYALTRDIIRGLRLGLWILSCATEEQVHRIEEDEEFHLTPEMIKDMEAAYSTDPFFHNLKKRWDGQFSLYARKRMVQLGRWHTGLSAGLDADQEGIRHVTTTATLCVVLLAAEFLANQKHSADSKQIEALAADYPPQIS
jgi:hypothetical protein